MVGSLNWSITVGSEGEVTQSTLIVRDKSSATTYSAQVLSYNQKANIVAPRPNDVQSLSGTTLPSLFSSTAFTTLLVPKNLNALGRANIS
jgi:hypothetical protein